MGRPKGSKNKKKNKKKMSRGITPKRFTAEIYNTRRMAENYAIAESAEQIEEHTGNYIHVPVPGWQRVLAFLAMVASVGLSWAWFNVLQSLWTHFGMTAIMESTPETAVSIYAHHYSILPVIVTQYLFVALAVVSAVAMLKGGFDKLNKYNEEGLISSLIVNSVVWPTGPTTLGLFAGLLSNMSGGGFIGSIVGLVTGLVIALGTGLIGGLMEEW